MLDTSFLKIVTISFSALVFTELLNIMTMVSRPNIYIIVSNLFSLGFYIISVIFFRKFLGLQKIDWDSFQKIMIIVFICWVPFEIAKRVKRCIWPSLSDKVMQKVKDKASGEGEGEARGILRQRGIGIKGKAGVDSLERELRLEGARDLLTVAEEAESNRESIVMSL